MRYEYFPGYCLRPWSRVVFYVDDAALTGAQFMEAAPNGWNAPTTIIDPELSWGANVDVGPVNCSNDKIAGAIGINIGTGLATPMQSPLHVLRRKPRRRGQQETTPVALLQRRDHFWVGSPPLLAITGLRRRTRAARSSPTTAACQGFLTR